jgi:cell shape-determining protein MreD
MIEQKSLAKSILLNLFAIVLVIMNLTNVNIAGFNDIMPAFDVMAIFYFTIYKNIFGLFFVFLLGIWNDSLNGNSLGVTALLYIILIKFFQILNNRILNKDNFIKIWQQFIYFLILYFFGKWFFLIIINGGSSSFSVLFVQIIISSLFYIPMHKLFDYLSTKLLGE